MEIENIIEQQRLFFKSQQTKDISFRKNALKKLLAEVQRNEEAIQNAFAAELEIGWDYNRLCTQVHVLVKQLLKI